MLNAPSRQPGRRLFAIAALAGLLSGCAISPPKEKSCAFRQLSLDPLPPGMVQQSRGGPLRLEDELVSALQPPPVPFGPQSAGPTPPPPRLLYLSGGSQNGSFGAGVFHQWALNRCQAQDSKRTETDCLNLLQATTEQPRERFLPDFDAITCISTGCLQAGFIMADRPDLLVRGYNLGSEADVLSPYLKGGREKLTTLRGAFSVLRNGAVGDLVPLRDRLRQLLAGDESHPDILLRIADVVERHRGPNGERSVLVAGVVDLDSGKAVGLDIGEIAVAYKQAPRQSPAADALRDCYIEAVSASSSVPLSARPTFINNRMYVDGGVRLGLFDDVMAKVMERAQKVEAWMVVNGTLETTSRCGKANPKDCKDPQDSAAAIAGAHKKWNLADAALRTVDLQTNSNYRLSAALIARNAEILGRRLHSLRLDPKVSEHEYRDKTCSEWRLEDEANGKPLQFHPNEMRCMVDFGRKRACALADFDGKSATGCGTSAMPATLITRR